jgi:hypothetical protein
VSANTLLVRTAWRPVFGVVRVAREHTRCDIYGWNFLRKAVLHQLHGSFWLEGGVILALGAPERWFRFNSTLL